MVKRINKRVHIEKNQLLLYQGGVMTMLIMGTGVVYSPSLVLLDTAHPINQGENSLIL